MGGLYFYRSKTRLGAAQIMGYVPAGPSLLIYLDVGALRQAGLIELLAGSKVAEDPEYRAFVEQTQFDYRKDLYAVAASFRADEAFYVIHGRFDWNALKSYALLAGGACWDAACSAPSSRPNRYLSFMPVRTDLMVLVVSPSRGAVRTAVTRARRSAKEAQPDQPVWISIPPAVLLKPDSFPTGTQLFAKALQDSDNVTFSIAPADNRFQARLDVLCRSTAEAALIEAQFERITDVLRKLIASNGQTPNPRDLSGVLTNGTFRREERRVRATWPIERAFLETIAGGSL